MATTATALEATYRTLWRAAAPLVRWYVRRKDAQRLVDLCATQERFGRSQRPRDWDASSSTPWVLWIHGASVGECLSALPVVEFVLSPRFPIAQQRPTRVVLTTTTAAARRLATTDGRAACIFAPLDTPASVARFYDAWRPDAGIWVESELWPTLILEASRRKIPIGVVNARISFNSLRWWSMPLLRSFIRHVVGRFSLVLCQDESNSARYRRIGATDPRIATNLKFASPWVHSDASKLDQLRQNLEGRPVWLAASTHEGEELLMARIHHNLSSAKLAGAAKRLLTVVIPRHPERTAQIIQQIQQHYPSLSMAQRSVSSLPSTEVDVFIVDTMGETALFFDAIATVAMGGTFVPRGGHNPIEPLRAGCSVAIGPNSFNFSDIVSQLQNERGGVISEVGSVDELSDWLAERLGSEPDPTHSQSTRQLLQKLSVQTMTTYETALVNWLVTDTLKRKTRQS